MRQSLALRFPSNSGEVIIKAKNDSTIIKRIRQCNCDEMTLKNNKKKRDETSDDLSKNKQ